MVVSKARLLKLVGAVEMGVDALEDFCKLASHLTEDMAAGFAALHKGITAVRTGIEALP